MTFWFEVAVPWGWPPRWLWAVKACVWRCWAPSLQGLRVQRPVKT